MEKVESFIKRIRWKAHFFDQSLEDNVPKNDNFGFKSTHTPPVNSHLANFENDLYELVRNIEFRHVKNEFLDKLKSDITAIKSSGHLLIPADKTNNLYEITTTEYEKLLKENITKSYEKCSSNVTEAINKEAATIAKALKLENKMECFSEKNAYVTIKDHKENFPHNIKCRLINPAKSDMGKVSKQFLENIISKVQNVTNVNQWRNTSTVINWFTQINSNRRSRFLKFDIVDFYPSISEELLSRAIEFAKSVTNIEKNMIDVIKLSRKSLLFDKSSPWVKTGNVLFDVTMGSFDGAEVCELVGLYLLEKLSNLLGKTEVGLYRDDGLAIVQNANGPKMDKLRKEIVALFKIEGLSITIDTNLTETDFLDVSFNLSSKTYKPYRKPNNDPLYVNTQSNHPKTVLDAIPKMVNHRLCETSCDINAFNDAKTTYEASLIASGFQHKLSYARIEQPKNRKRKIVWFNPPYSRHVKTNIGKSFLKLVRKHFNHDHKYHKIFNKNTVKISYSCSTNVGNIIKGHNSKILNADKTPTQRPCNCRNKELCPMNGECLATTIIYKADIKYDNFVKTYYGQCEGEFKTRFNNHTKSFRHEKHRNDTELSKLVWKLKDENKDYSLNWSIAARASPYKNGAKYCDLCVTEKVIIVRSEPRGLINKRTELVSKCRHRNKFLLRNLKVK